MWVSGLRRRSTGGGICHIEKDPRYKAASSAKTPLMFVKLTTKQLIFKLPSLKSSDNHELKNLSVYCPAAAMCRSDASRVRLNHQRKERCLWIRTPRGVPPFSVILGSPGDQTSSRLDVPRPSFDLLRRSWGDPKPPLTRRREDHFCGYPLSGIASSPELSPHISYYVRFDR